MTVYRVYDLRFESTLPFPELPREPDQRSGPADVDVRLLLEPIGVERPADVDAESWYRAEPRDLAVHWADFGSARVEDGRIVRLDPRADIAPIWQRAVVLGTLFSVVLMQRGLFPLHGGAVVVGDGARAFVGRSGAGKSSLTGALTARGHALVADDVTPLESVAAGPPRVHPGRAEIKLDDASAAALGVDPAGLEELFRDEGKGVLRQGLVTTEDAHELDALYLLEWGDQVSIEPLPRQEIFRLFVEHGHRPELFLASLGEAEAMRRCADLASRTRAFRLVRPRALGRLDEIARLVEEHDPGSTPS